MMLVGRMLQQRRERDILTSAVGSGILVALHCLSIVADLEYFM